jgi:diacylglycerol kinase family enzyme
MSVTSIPLKNHKGSFPDRRKTERVAVLLNANAKNVTEGLRREIARFVPSEDVYFSRSLADARVIASNVLDSGYTTLLTGGGDGTFVGYVNEVFQALSDEVPSMVSRGGAVRQLAARRRLPKFGVLRLGTGNSLAGLTGASASTVGVVEDILRARSGDVRQTRRLRLIDAGNKLAPFAGLGIDARVLNDYVAVKSRFHGTALEKLAAGPAGYFMSVVGMTVPTTLMQREAPIVTVINEGAPAQQVGPDGRPVGKPVATGDVIYRGPCRLAAAGTVPNYGYGFQIFPHALRAPGRMHLRLTAMTTTQILRHLPAIWKGRTPTCSLLDFHADKVKLAFDRPMPFQIGGDAEGYRDQVTLSMDSRPVELLDFKAQA